MIQFKRALYGLDKLYYDYVDNDPHSRSIFRVMSIPDTLKLGKNEIRMLASSDVLVKGSRIYIDIIDSSGNPLYYEVSQLANKDGSRSIIVYVYKDTAPGACRIIIAGRLGIDPRSEEKIYFNDLIINEPNVKWETTTNVSPYEENDGRIKYVKDPTATYTERIEYLQVLSGSSRLDNVYASSSSRITMRSIITPAQGSDLGTERSEIFKPTPVQPKMVGDISRSETVDLPYFTGLSMLSSDNFMFSASMQGGVIELNGIQLEAPKDAVDPSVFSGFSYTASIIRVVSDNQIEVYPAFQRSIKYKNISGNIITYSANTFINHSNFTASFYNVYALSSSLTTQSFLEVNAYGIEPSAGVLDSINIAYKPINSFGDYINLGDYRITSRNLLTDSGSITFDHNTGITERSIGKFETSDDFRRYWESGSIGNVISVAYDNDVFPIKVVNGVLLKTNATNNADRFAYFTPKYIYNPTVERNTECEISFQAFLESSDVDGVKSQIDVYISGSGEVYSQRTDDELYYTPVKNPIFGTHIGSITAERGLFRSEKINFYVRETGVVRPYFLLRSGHWHFGNVELKPRHELGFTPNQSKLYVPLTDVERETELSVRLQYKDRFGVRSDRETYLHGLYFSGSSPIQFSEIANVPPTIGGVYSISSSYHRLLYFTASDANVDNAFGSMVTIKFPIFQNDNTLQVYTGSIYNVGMMFSINTTIHAKTGSSGFPQDTYVWGGQLQGRAVISPSENSGLPSLYNIVAMSGSSYNQMGTFGNGHASKTNLDSWFSVFSVLYDGAGSPYLNIRYRVQTSSSMAWQANAVSTCEVWKYEQKLVG